MIDIDEIQRRAREAREKASGGLREAVEKSEALAGRWGEKLEEKPSSEAAQAAANARRQVEILGQTFSGEDMAQMAARQAQMAQMIQEQMAQAASMGAESVISQLFGEDMGVVAAALETLAMEEDDEEEGALGLEEEQALYTLLEDTMARLEAMPEPESESYGKDAARWERFGVLLSGIVSTLNDHRLDGMDVEEHIPVMEQQVASIVRRSWGIDGRADLLDMIRYLSREGYTLRYRIYAQADSPEELWDEDGDQEDRENTARAWRFAQRYRDRYAPGFMAGWDVGRAAMLTRWGCYLGWLTREEAEGLLWDLSQQAAEELNSWREFAQSYLFGGLMWKLLCGDPSAASYLGYIADAAAALLAGKEGRGGQWRDFPWPARRKIGFVH